VDDQHHGEVMRILFVSGEHAELAGTGGVGAYLQAVTRALARAGHDVHVLICRDAPVSDRLSHDVYLHIRPLLRLPGLARVVRGPITRERLIFGLSTWTQARRLGLPFDIVEAPDWRAEGLLFALLGQPLVTHLHTPTGLLHEYAGSAPSADVRRADRIEAWTVNRAAAVTSPSQLLVDDLRGRGWLQRNDTQIIRYPVDLDTWAMAPAADVVPARVVVLGRVEARKTPELLVEAAALLRTRGVVCLPTFVGRGSGERDGLAYEVWLRHEAQRRGVAIDLVGERPRRMLPAFVAAAQVVCVPSLYESFSMAAVEGMAAGRPVVATSRVGASEVLPERLRSQVCAHTPLALANALEPLLRDPVRARASGEAGRLAAERECNSYEVARLRVVTYEQVIAAPRRFPGGYVHLHGFGRGQRQNVGQSSELD
jgi:glycogen(starch) synthase